MEDRMTGRELVKLYADLRGVTDSPTRGVATRSMPTSPAQPAASRAATSRRTPSSPPFHQPRLIMLDEPTRSGSTARAGHLPRRPAGAKQRGQTVFLSSHVLPEIERVADRVGIIREGELIATENPRELTGRTFRHVRISFREPASESLLSRFRQLAGVDHLDVVDRQHLAFQAHGDINEVVRLAGEQDLAAIDIERPSLEEMFIKYYDGHTAKGAAA